jgi:hypothetical protein
MREASIGVTLDRGEEVAQADSFGEANEKVVEHRPEPLSGSPDERGFHAICPQRHRAALWPAR